MTAKELTKKAKSSYTVAFHKFVLLQKENSRDLFCFYEGNDNGYYFPRIKSHYNGVHHPIRCGNKKSVIGVHRMIKEKYPSIKTSFYIDRDFDEKINLSEIYETPSYSIENFYATENFISDVLKNEFHLLETDPEYKNSIELFKENQSVYHEKSVLFNAWYATAKSMAKIKKCETNITLNCSIPKKFVLINIGNITGEYNLETIESEFPNAIKVSLSEVENKIENFRKGNLNQVLRGKYELEFIYNFLQFLIEDSNDKTKRSILKKKTSFRVDKAQLLSQLSQYADTPECLIEYIQSFN